MESSCRPTVGRSRELPGREFPGAKKRRLSDDAHGRDRAVNGGGVSSSKASIGNQQLNPRFRANERHGEEREDSFRGGSSSSSSSSFQQQQELVAQYKTALAELTFNSKPIITNLTIIAGENHHAAKGIAATICNNVLEVPTEQKLPSLYLLDSIVKNIGRDYIKYFAARLPEVFCKAYKQVDSSIHPGMRHLFGTWKGVFPFAPLQLIEKELGFPLVNNGSSGTTTSKLDSQAQRPAHSIHVNPKYLEARQRLQQTRAKEMNGDDRGDAVASVEDAERPDRASITGSTRQWADLSSKMPNIQRPQRELSNDPSYGKKGLRDVDDHQFSSIHQRPADMGVGRIPERSKERDDLDKSYFGAGGPASETAINRRNSFDANYTYGNYRTSGFAQADHQLHSVHDSNTHKNVQPVSRIWKNSGDEEYMWDDLDSKLPDYGGNNNSIKGDWNVDKTDECGSLQRGQRLPSESEETDIRRDIYDTFSRLKPSVGERGQRLPSESEETDIRRDIYDTFSRLKPSAGEDRVPLFRDIDANHLQPHNQWDTDPRRNLETSVQLVSVGRAPSRRHTSSLWLQREPLLAVSGVNQTRFAGQSEGTSISLNSGSSTNLIPHLPRSGLLSHSHTSSSVHSTDEISGGPFGQQCQQPFRPPSPSAHPPTSLQPLLHQKLHIAIEPDHPQPPYSEMEQKPIKLPGYLNMSLHTSVTHDSSPGLPQSQSQQSCSHNLHQPQSQSSQLSSTTYTQLRHRPPSLHQSQPELPQAQTQSKLLIHAEKPRTSQGSGTLQAHEFSGVISSTSSVDVSGQSSTGDLLAAIMKSGLLPNNSKTGSQNFNIQPPLPSGPPPFQALTVSDPMVTPLASSLQTSQGDTPALTEPLMGVMLPPLPPGPPPSSYLACTSSQQANAANAIANPFSSLLSSLVAKGIISTPATETPISSSAELPTKVPDPIIEIHSSTLVQVPSTPEISSIPPAAVNEPSIPTGVTAFPSNVTELEDLLGIDFKPEIIRELHPSVIGSLFDDLNHQCDICSLRFKLREQLHSHSDLHTSDKSELSRRWYSNTSNWVAGNVEPRQVQLPATSLEEVEPGSEECELMVPADESQSICALCGEPFEDFYSHERDEWMYKGTIYLNSSERKGDVGIVEELNVQVPIVHAKCMSRPADNKGMAENDKMDWTDG